jgi:beta-glucosidase
MDADPWMVMTSYNKINGEHADMSKFLMQDVLRSEWKFKGTIISDWGGTNDTVKSVTAGTDLEMPGPAVRRGVHLLAAIKEDNIQVCEVESCVRRILKILSRANWLGPFPELVVEMIEKAAKVSTLSAELNPVEVRRSYNEEVLESAEESNDIPEHRKLLRETAISGMVLLKNNGILPLRAEKLKKVAIIGPNAKNPTAGGSGSAALTPHYITTPYDSFVATSKAQNLALEISHAKGMINHKLLPLLKNIKTPDGADGVRMDFFQGYALEGPVIGTRVWKATNIFLMTDGDVPDELKGKEYSFRLSGILKCQLVYRDPSASQGSLSSFL